MSDDRPCTCPPMERPHPCARKFALSECKAATVMDPFCYLTQTSSAKNPPHGWSVHFTDGDIPLYTADALAAAREEGRLAGLEEAALEVDLVTRKKLERADSMACAMPTPENYMAAIRALKEKRDE